MLRSFVQAIRYVVRGNISGSSVSPVLVGTEAGVVWDAQSNQPRFFIGRLDATDDVHRDPVNQLRMVGGPFRPRLYADDGEDSNDSVVTGNIVRVNQGESTQYCSTAEPQGLLRNFRTDDKSFYDSGDDSSDGSVGVVGGAQINQPRFFIGRLDATDDVHRDPVNQLRMVGGPFRPRLYADDGEDSNDSVVTGNIVRVNQGESTQCSTAEPQGLLRNFRTDDKSFYDSGDDSSDGSTDESDGASVLKTGKGYIAPGTGGAIQGHLRNVRLYADFSDDSEEDYNSRQESVQSVIGVGSSEADIEIAKSLYSSGVDTLDTQDLDNVELAGGAGE